MFYRRSRTERHLPERHLLAVAVTALALTLFLAPRPAEAWGPNGHRIVAQIAEDSLSPSALAAVREIAGTKGLALLATWADFIRSEPKWDCVKPWHYLTVEDAESLEKGLAREAQTSELCRGLFDEGDLPENVVEAIDYLAAILSGEQDTVDSFAALLEGSGVEPYEGSMRLTALALVVHFVGDIHQPLHVGRGGDLGGNRIRVEWFGRPTSLHSLWDSGLLENEHLSFTEFVTFLEQEHGGEDVEFGSGAATWARESFSHRSQVYDIGDGDPAQLSYDYATAQNALLKQRLYRSGKRLGKLLNLIHG